MAKPNTHHIADLCEVEHAVDVVLAFNESVAAVLACVSKGDDRRVAKTPRHSAQLYKERERVCVCVCVCAFV